MKLLFGIKPTRIHIGHLLSIFNFIKTNKYKSLGIDIDNIYCLIGDIHKFASMKSIQEIKINVNNIKEISSILKIKYYQQYYLPREYFITYHIISFLCNTNRLDKVFKINYFNNTNNNFAKFAYPVLMCTDIILMNPCIVLVGKDQIHNIRFVKEILLKINKEYKLNIDIKFEVINTKILNLNNQNKMSTSDNNNNQIFIDMTDNEIIKIISKSKTQTKIPKQYSDLEISTYNLYNIYAQINNLDIEQVIYKFQESDFTTFKKYLCNSIIELINFYRKKTDNKFKYNAQEVVNNIIKYNFNKIYNLIL